MNLHGKRTRLGGMLVAAAAALAMLALPGLASSHDHHGLTGDAGVIHSFDPATGVLTIDLTAGGSVSGLVVRRTHIRCGEDNGHHHGLHGEDHRRGRGGAATSHDDSGDRGNSGPGDDNSGRGEEPGEDTPGRGDEPGEDAPGHDGTPPGSSEDPGHGAEHSNRCTSEDLVSGATVRVANLVLTDGKAIYAFVGLEPPAPEGGPTI